MSKDYKRLYVIEYSPQEGKVKSITYYKRVMDELEKRKLKSMRNIISIGITDDKRYHIYKICLTADQLRGKLDCDDVIGYKLEKRIGRVQMFYKLEYKEKR